MMITIGNKRVDNTLITYLAVCYTLIMSGSVYQYAYMSTLGIINIFVALLLLCFRIAKHGTNSIRVKKNIVDIFVVFSGIGLLACMIAWLDFSFFMDYLSKFCVVLMPCLICKYIKIEDFMRAYIKIIFFLAVASLVFYLFPTVLQLLPYKIVIETSKWSFDNYLIYAAYHNPIYSIQERNIGVFWEPGMYQGFLIFAMIYIATKKRRTFRTFLFQLVVLGTILTTQSSTGYILLVLVLLIYVLASVSPEKKKIRIGLSMLIIVAVSILLFYPQFFYSLLDTLFPGITNKLLAGNDGGSMGTRIYSMLTDGYLVVRHPFGIGTQLDEYRSNALRMFGFLTDGANINTTFTMMLYYGWVSGVLYFIMMVKGCFRFFGNNLIGVIVTIVMLIIINTEPHYMTLFFTVIFMGCVKYNGTKDLKIER